MDVTLTLRLPKRAPVRNVAVVAKVEDLKVKTREAEALTNPQREQIKAEEDLQVLLQAGKEDHLTQEPADARERRAVAAAAALKVLLKEEDQKSNPLRHFWYSFP